VRVALPPLLRRGGGQDGLTHVGQAALGEALELGVARAGQLLQPHHHAHLLHEFHVLEVGARVLHGAQRVDQREPVLREEVRQQPLEAAHLLEHALGQHRVRVDGIRGQVADEQQGGLVEHGLLVLDERHEGVDAAAHSQVLAQHERVLTKGGVHNLCELP